MTDFFVIDHDGNIVRTGSCQPQNVDAQGGAGLMVKIGTAHFGQFYDLNAQSLANYDEATIALMRRNPGHGYRWSLGQWIDERTLPMAKAQKWDEIKRARSKSEASGFSAEGHLWDSDERSQQQIALAVQDMNYSGQDLVNWKTADNNLIPLDTMNMRGLLQALRSHIQDRRNRAEDLRWRIESATSVAEVAALAWEG